MTQPASFNIPTSAEQPVSPTVMFPAVQASLTALLDSNSGTVRPSYATPGMVWRNSTTGQLFLWDGVNDTPIALDVGVPPLATSPGQPGFQAVESGFFYKCVAVDTWERVATATF